MIRPGPATLLPAVLLVIWRDWKREMFEFADLKKAVVYGSLLASFCVESFSLDRLKTLSREEIDERYRVVQINESFRS